MCSESLFSNHFHSHLSSANTGEIVVEGETIGRRAGSRDSLNVQGWPIAQKVSFLMLISRLSLSVP